MSPKSKISKFFCFKRRNSKRDFDSPAKEESTGSIIINQMSCINAIKAIRKISYLTKISLKNIFSMRFPT